MKESKIERYLCQRVRDTRGIERKAQWIGRRGAPDRWCGWPHTRRSAWVETKAPLSSGAEEHQLREHDRLRACGERVYVLSTIEAVDRFIEEMTK